MYLPTLNVIVATIKEGSVYYFVQSHFPSSEPHYFVILNPNPMDSTSLIVVNTTSNVKGREKFVKSRKFPESTLVKVGPSDCSFLRKTSVFDCNKPGEYTPQKLVERCKKGAFRHKDAISEKVLRQLKEGLEASPMVEERIKRIVREP